MDFVRGDTVLYKFKRLDSNGEVIKTIADEMWFTVRKNEYSENYLFQKTLDNGITFDEDGYYHIRIEHDDTANAEFEEYKYDIQIKQGNSIETIGRGTCYIDWEVTFNG